MPATCLTAVVRRCSLRMTIEPSSVNRSLRLSYARSRNQTRQGLRPTRNVHCRTQMVTVNASSRPAHTLGTQAGSWAQSGTTLRADSIGTRNRLCHHEMTPIRSGRSPEPPNCESSYPEVSMTGIVAKVSWSPFTWSGSLIVGGQ